MDAKKLEDIDSLDCAGWGWEEGGINWIEATEKHLFNFGCIEFSTVQVRREVQTLLQIVRKSGHDNFF